MKLSKILKSVGAGLIKEAVPGGGLLLSAVNELMPAGAKLAGDSTGEQISEAIESLPPDRRAELLGKEFDVEITQIKESSASLQAMLAADASSSHTTRPYIAKHSFHVVAAVVSIAVLMWAYAITEGDSDLVTAVTGGWPFILGAIAPFTILLQAYFGVLKSENKNKLDAANGNPTTSIVGGLISSFIKKG